jgi:hypothetical protein
MDFIISKVVMSITALIVVSILAGLLSPERFAGVSTDLERILDDLSSVVSRTAMSASEITITWTVPFLTTGGEVSVTVHNSILSGRSGGEIARVQPMFELHTWHYDGSMMNASTIDALDNASEDIDCSSGRKLTVCNASVQFENGSRLLIFLARAS